MHREALRIVVEAVRHGHPELAGPLAIPADVENDRISARSGWDRDVTVDRHDRFVGLARIRLEPLLRARGDHLGTCARQDADGPVVGRAMTEGERHEGLSIEETAHDLRRRKACELDASVHAAAT